VLKALEKGLVQPMYAKVREHGAPVQGGGLVEAGKAEDGMAANRFSFPDQTLGYRLEDW
jgi:hypothetical protein